jgi:hypothetical protein
MMNRFYEIRIEGHLDDGWQDWFDGWTVTRQADGTTLLSGPVPDQPALYGILRRVRDLGLPLISVTQLKEASHQQILNTQRIEPMNANLKFDKKNLLSTLWIVVMFCLLKADILSLFIPGIAEELAQTSAITGASIPQLMLFGAVMGTVGIAMILLTRILERGLNRWANLIVSPLYILYIVGGGTLYPHYIFLASVEVICLALIFWNALKWEREN